MLSGLIERFRDFRNRKVADPAFRRWAGSFPLTRPIARRQANALFDLTAGFVYSQVLHACVKVDLFALLAPGPVDVATISARIGLPRAGTLRLLKAAAALDLVEARSNGRFALATLGAALVGNAGVQAMILHNGILYDDLRDPLALLAGNATPGLRQYWAYAGGTTAAAEPRRHDDYTRLMAASQALITAEILDAYPLARHKRLLDVGGGDASFLIAAGLAAPHLELSMFDLPPVAAMAGRRIHDAGLAGRATAHAGSFFDDDLPRGADLVTLNRVLHDHDDAAARSILHAIRKAIAPGGTLLVTEPMAGTRHAEASGDAYFGFYLLAMGQGRPRTFDEVQELLQQAGFVRAAELPNRTPLIARIVVGRAGMDTAQPHVKGN